jgi:hypothetical protein
MSAHWQMRRKELETPDELLPVCKRAESVKGACIWVSHRSSKAKYGQRELRRRILSLWLSIDSLLVLETI